MNLKFQEFETVSFFGDSVFNGKITLDEANKR